MVVVVVGVVLVVVVVHSGSSGSTGNNLGSGSISGTIFVNLAFSALR